MEGGFNIHYSSLENMTLLYNNFIYGDDTMDHIKEISYHRDNGEIHVYQTLDNNHNADIDSHNLNDCEKKSSSCADINLGNYYVTNSNYSPCANSQNSDVHCRQIMKQLLEAVHFVHKKNIVHRDLKVSVCHVYS